LYFKKGLKIREAIGDKKGIAACYLDLAVCYQRELNIRACEDFYKKALNNYQEIGYQEGIVIAFLDLGTLYADYNLPKAEEYFLNALSVSKLIGAKRNIVVIANNLGDIHRYRSMNDQALKNYRQALKLAKEIKFDEGLIVTNVSLSEFYRETGKLKKGQYHLKLGQHIAKKINLKYYNIICIMEELNYLFLSRNLKKLTSLSEKLISQLKFERNINYRIYGLLYRARVMTKLKKYAKAHIYYNKAHNLVKSLPDSEIAGEIYYFKAIAYKKENRLKEALKMFLQANRIFEAVGNLRYLGKIEEEIAKTHIK